MRGCVRPLVASPMTETTNTAMMLNRKVLCITAMMFNKLSLSLSLSLSVEGTWSSFTSRSLGSIGLSLMAALEDPKRKNKRYFSFFRILTLTFLLPLLPLPLPPLPLLNSDCEYKSFCCSSSASVSQMSSVPTYMSSLSYFSIKPRRSEGSPSVCASTVTSSFSSEMKEYLRERLRMFLRSLCLMCALCGMVYECVLSVF